MSDEDWHGWLQEMFPTSVSRGFGEHHEEYWNHLWEVTPDSDPAPFIGIWSRGGGKSSSAELGCAALGLRGQRLYVLYVRDTQDRADDSVQNVAALLESESVERHYPEHADRLLGKYGDSKGWRRNRLRTRGGFTVDALGLDVAGRGVKLEDMRPDVIIFDDIDGRHDTQKATKKKMATITDSLLPAGTDNVFVIGIQNLIIPNGVFSRLSDGRAAFLSGRKVSGPYPAVRGLKTERRSRPDGSVRHVITEGAATWSGQALDACQRLIDRMGLSAFLRECQHQVQEREGALWSRDLINEFRVSVAPRMKRVVVGVDPSGGGDDIGIVGAGLGHNGHGYTLEDRSQPGRLGPNNWAKAAVNLYYDLEADAIVAEKNFGGDMVLNTIKTVDPTVRVKLVSASRGKDVRAEPVASLAEDGREHHVGTLEELETEMTSWAAGDKESPNRCFVAGTSIRTLHGNTPIEDLRVRDLVLTRDGYKPVAACGMTELSADVLTVELSNGSTLTGTPDHPVWTDNRGWVELDSLGCDDILRTCVDAKTSSIKTSSIRVFPLLPIAPLVSTTTRLAAAAKRRFTAKFTKRTTGLSRRAAISITETATRSTTTPQTLSALLLKNTLEYTRRIMQRFAELGLSKSDPSPANGTVRMKAGHGTRNTVGGRGTSAKLTSLFAPTAEEKRSATIPGSLVRTASGTAPGSVLALPLMLPIATSAVSRVLFAGQSFGRTDTERSPRRAAVSVVRSYASGVVPVYNLTVADKPEYFANGILVHNCDAKVWALTELMLTSTTEPTLEFV